jgi:hypothetical protein
VGTGIHHQTDRQNPTGQLASQCGCLFDSERTRAARPQDEPDRIDAQANGAVNIG